MIFFTCCMCWYFCGWWLFSPYIKFLSFKNKSFFLFSKCYKYAKETFSYHHWILKGISDNPSPIGFFSSSIGADGIKRFLLLLHFLWHSIIGLHAFWSLAQFCLQGDWIDCLVRICRVPCHQHPACLFKACFFLDFVFLSFWSCFTLTFIRWQKSCIHLILYLGFNEASLKWIRWHRHWCPNVYQ